jgi:ribosome-associated heat shock protein Hsp15
MRLDKWLWAARFFKTRTLAVEAVTGGRVSINHEHAKPAKEVKAGDLVAIRRPPFEHVVVVKALSDKRGPRRQRRCSTRKPRRAARAARCSPPR